MQATTIGLSRIYRIEFPAAPDVREIVESYANDLNIEYAQPVGVHKVYGTIPNDQYFSNQWGMTKIQAPDAWDVARGDTSVILAIIDTGVDWKHPDLGGNSPYLHGNIWTNWAEYNGTTGVDDDNNGLVDDIRGWDWVNVVSSSYPIWPGEDGTVEDNDPMDFNGHGTHCAGIASAITDNVTGVAGVGWGCKIMALRAGWSADYFGYEVGLVNMDFCAQAIYYAARNGASAINCSWGSSNTAGIADAVTFATSMGAIVVSAAGNDDISDASYLCSRHDCISVAATDPNDNKASYSSFGFWVDVSAPGGDYPPTTDEIYSTYYDHNTNSHTYEWIYGTSMAAPHVVGLTGLINDQFPTLDWRGIKERLQFTSDNIDLLNPNYKNGLLGEGRINAFSAVTQTNLPLMTTFFSENFDTGLPASWTADPYWRDDDPANRNTLFDDIYDPGTIKVGYDVWTPPFMIVDSYYEGAVPINASLVTPIIDCSMYSDIRLVFNNWFQNYYGGGIEKGDIDVRIDNGPWQTIASFISNTSYDVVDAGREIMIRLPSSVDYQGKVQIRWHYYDANDDWFWGIDNVNLIGNMIDTDYYVQLFPLFQASGGQQGDTLSYMEKVKNIGLLSDSYDLSVSGNSWTTTIWDSAGINQITNTGVLSSREELYIMIKVEIPAGSAIGDADTAYITAASMSDTSVLAEATILTAVKPPPDKIPWFEDFPTMIIDTTKWTYNTGPAEISTLGLNPPSPPYALNLNGDAVGGDEIHSNAIDLSAESEVILSYYYQRTGGGESPDSGDDLFVDYYNASGTWVNLKQYLGSEADMSIFEQDVVLLPADAYHSDFKIRFRNTATSGNYDDWFIDDILLAQPPDITVTHNPDPFEFIVNLGDSTSGSITIGNTGWSDLKFWVSHSSSTNIFKSNFLQANVFDPGNVSHIEKVANYDENARTAEGLYVHHKDINNTGILAAGDVLKSWPAPNPIMSPWGVGFDKENVWLSDPDGLEDHKVSTEGVWLSSFGVTSWVGTWPGDMAWDGKYIWQVNVGGDNGIYQLDPTTGDVINSIHDPNFTWDSISQRGLAYDRDTDTFYIGGWNYNDVYRIKGLSWNNPGEIISTFPFLSVSGLGWHPSGTLWIATNDMQDMIYQVNPDNGTILSQFIAPGSGNGYWGAGLEVDNNGNLWVICQDNNMVYLVDSGESLITWLKESPRFGLVAPGDSTLVTVSLYATDDTGLLPDSTYTATIHITSNDPTPGDEDIPIPVSLTVNPVDYYFRVSPTTLKSKGTAGDTTDSYDLASLGNTWLTTFWDSTGTNQINNTGPVVPKTEYDFIAKVEIPGTTDYGDMDTARVNITSVAKLDLSKSVLIESFSVGTPDTIPWFDDFPSNTLNSDKWIYNSGPAEVNQIGINEPSPPYSLNLNGDATGGDEVRSSLIDLSNDSLVILSYQWQRTGGGNSPESGDDLWVDYLNSSGVWKNLRQYPGSGPDDSTYTAEDIPLPSDAYHNAFQVRFHSSGTTGTLTDDWFVDDVLITYPPEISVTPESYQERIRAGEKITAKPPMHISNSGEGVLKYNIISLPIMGPNNSLQFEPANRNYPDEYYVTTTEKEGNDSRIGASVVFNAGGPDNHGYFWIDSDEPGGPAFDWIDISNIGTAFQVSGDNQNLGFFPIGFTFPFYDNEYTMFRFCTNGFISFSSSATSSYNEPIPNQSVFDLVAPFWDDLYFDSSSKAYYHYDGKKLIIQYNNVEKDFTVERNTFEILLYPDGTIVFQYLIMQSSSNSATVGIQNNNGSDGLEISFNTDYVHDQLAVHITRGVPWIDLSQTKGVIAKDSSDTVKVDFTAEDINVDTTLYANIIVRSNDPGDSSIVIPVTLEVITNETITGSILAAGISLENAVAQVWDEYPNGLIIDQDTTTADGKYLLEVPPEGGIYTVRAYAKGYLPAFKEDVPGNTEKLNFALKPVMTITPTTEWVDFFSDNSKFWGGPVQIGDVISAEDPDSVICGIFTVDKPAYYGFMPVYKDDDTTPGIDEGAQPGDTITFRINGYLAETLGPDNPVWTSHASILHVDLNVEEIDTLNIPLATGWNLISWNVDTPEDSTHTILKEISAKVIVVLGYENGGLTYKPGLPTFSNLQIMDHLHGYWIKMAQADTLVVIGNPVDYQQTPVYCESGWNLVSYLSESPDSVAHSLETVIDNLVRAYGFKNGAMTFDPQMPEFSTLHILCRTFGYWLYLTQNDTLGYPEPLPGVQCPYEDLMLVKMIASAGQNSGGLIPTNEWVNVFGEGIKLDNKLLPVGTRIYARDPNGITCGEFVVSTPGKFGFMPIYRDDPHSDIDEGCQPGDEISIYFNDFEIPVKVTWNGFGDIVDLGAIITSVVGDMRNLPTAYNLSPNYPNPFNPGTTIKFQLPKPGYVTLKIYNMLGQLVRTLVAEQKEAGYFQIAWDGRDNHGIFVANGIYLFRLKAGNYEKTRKMIMLK
ncbi:MAG: hypothetical protein AMS26_10845 [Bacteroides sp. SM23_62]|nr:MAG: hypothetical protein AMS26_10845 [Bacteroides sp. SM23_62]